MLLIKKYYMFLMLIIISISGAGCGRDGSDPYAMWDSFSHPEGVYHFFYMMPPWSFHSDSSDVHPVLIIDNNDTMSVGGLGSRIRLEAWYNGSDTALELASDRINYWFHNGYDSGDVVDFVNYYGDLGLTFTTEFENHQVRELFFDCGTGSIAMSVWVQGNANTADINLLLNSFECGSGWKI